MTKKEKAAKICAAYGSENQLRQTIEECAELTKAICKEIRYGGKRSEIVEEAADVAVCLEHIKLLAGISERDFEGLIDYKLTRELKRLENRDKG